MNYQEFISFITKQMQNLVSDGSTVAIHSVRKNNGVVMKAMSVKKAGVSVCPLIYLAPFYRMYLAGRAFADILEELKSLSEMEMMDQTDTVLFFQYREASRHLAFRMIDNSKNREILSQIPHRNLLDFAVIYYLSIDIADGRKGSAVVYNDHMEMWGVDEEQLYRTAMENTPKILPIRAESLDSVLEHLILNRDFQTQQESSGVFVITNQFGYYGAAAAFYPGALKELSGALGGDLYLLPSSVHEFLALPVRDAPSCEFLEQTVGSVNAGHVEPEDVLSDHVYLYEAGTDRVMRALPD